MSADGRRTRGFTLIELLVAIALMTILLGSVTLIFIRTTETVATAGARTAVYTNARYAMDSMENDLLGSLSCAGGTQRFIMQDGRTVGPPAAAPVYTAGGAGPHYASGSTGAADRLIFRTTTAVGNTIQAGTVCYELIPANASLITPTGTLPLAAPGYVGGSSGDTARGQTVRGPPRPLYTLVRRVRVPNPAAPVGTTDPYSSIPLAADRVTQVPDGELCSYIISFNIEYLANDMSFSQLQPSPCDLADPLGESQALDSGTNDGKVPGTPALRVPYIRITMVVLDDIGARQERTIQKTLWIPMG